ncbi:MAG: DUF4147 domain-containing protein [Acidobacteria bacterium]|nr:DUF4147 domain-containing protein [Acidobacteriota bacterium]
METSDRLSVRRDATRAFAAAVDAVRPAVLLRHAVARSTNAIEVSGIALPNVSGRRMLVAIGKAAPGLAAAWLRELPGWADEIFVLTPHGVPAEPSLEAAATIRRGAHPFPDAAGEAAARELLERAGRLGTNDLLVVLLSGGGSALLAAPERGLTREEVTATTRALLASGAPIGAVNTVRREILAAGGGGLAAAAAPARVVTFILSDVVGDPLPDIASGPTVPSPTGPADALVILERYGIAGDGAVTAFLRRRARAAACEKPSWTGRTSTVILANNGTATDAAARRLEADGYRVLRAARFLTGEASARGRQLAALAQALVPRAPYAIVFGGETTVTVRGTGRGGRNQELALAAAILLDGVPGRVLLAAGTDGIDGMSPNAGALIDGTTAARIRAAGIDPSRALAANDSATALEAAGDVLVTGPTGTNVCDLTLLLATPAPR